MNFKYLCFIILFAGGLEGKTHMARQIRSDITVGNLEKKLGVQPGAFRNPDGRDTRSDKKLGTMRKEAEKKHK